MKQREVISFAKLVTSLIASLCSFACKASLLINYGNNYVGNIMKQREVIS